MLHDYEIHEGEGRGEGLLQLALDLIALSYSQNYQLNYRRNKNICIVHYYRAGQCIIHSHISKVSRNFLAVNLVLTKQF